MTDWLFPPRVCELRARGHVVRITIDGRCRMPEMLSMPISLTLREMLSAGMPLNDIAIAMMDPREKYADCHWRYSEVQPDGLTLLHVFTEKATDVPHHRRPCHACGRLDDGHPRRYEADILYGT